MKKIFAALLGLAALEGIASAQTSPARIAYDVCYAVDWDYLCHIVVGGSVVVAATGQYSVSGPKWSPDGSRVAFVAADILVVNLADGVIANLTNHLGGSSPAWSPDGATIAFTSNRDGLTELYVMHADGSGVRRLTDRIGFDGRPAWSPDSSRIALGCELEIGNQDICTINADGSGLVRLTTDPARDYGAVFTSGRIAFVTARFGPDTIAVLDDAGTVRGVSEGTDPAWSPDGTRIAFTNGGDVFVVAAEGGNPMNLTNDALGYYGPVWSPDGGAVAFGGTSIAGYSGTCYFGGGAHNADDFCVPMFGVYVANADGSAFNLLALGGNPDWLAFPPGRPVAAFTHQCSGSACEFDGSGSSDADGMIASYAWQFGDGSGAGGATTSHRYAAAGTYVVTLTVVDNSGETSVASRTLVLVSSGSTPYGGTPVILPGTIQGEHFDDGGPDVAYHDLTAGNSGGEFRRSTDVDLEATSDEGGGHNVGWIGAGEWLQYTVDASTTASYALTARVANMAAGGSIHVEVDGRDVTGPLSIPDTGGWQAWTNVSKAGITLSAGLHVVRVLMDTAASNGSVGNLNWIRLTLDSDRSDWTVFATQSAPQDPPSSAIDGNPNTRFSTGAAQHDNQGFIASWPGDRTIARIRMDVGPSTNDYPRRCGIWVKDTVGTVTFVSCVPDAHGNVDVSFSPIPATMIEVWQWGTSTSWWSIAEFDVF